MIVSSVIAALLTASAPASTSPAEPPPMLAWHLPHYPGMPSLPHIPSVPRIPKVPRAP